MSSQVIVSESLPLVRKLVVFERCARRGSVVTRAPAQTTFHHGEACLSADADNVAASVVLESIFREHPSMEAVFKCFDAGTRRWEFCCRTHCRTQRSADAVRQLVAASRFVDADTVLVWNFGRSDKALRLEATRTFDSAVAARAMHFVGRDVRWPQWQVCPVARARSLRGCVVRAG